MFQSWGNPQALLRHGIGTQWSWNSPSGACRHGRYGSDLDSPSMACYDNHGGKQTVKVMYLCSSKWVR